MERRGEKKARHRRVQLQMVVLLLLFTLLATLLTGSRGSATQDFGDKIDVVVLEVDAENRRLSLGHKQLEENPWDVYETIFEVGTVHQGTVASVNDKGATITLPYDVEGFCPMRHLEKADKSKAKQGEVLDFKVIEFSKENKKIIVSHARVHQENAENDRVKAENEEAKKDRATKKTVKKINDNLEKTTLGDLSVLASLKEEIEKEEKGE